MPDKWLYTFTAGKPPKQLVILTEHNRDVKKWAASVLQWREFRQGAIVRRKGRKLELIAIWEFVHA